MPPKDVPPPLKASELQEKIRSGQVRFESAPREETRRYEKELRALLLLIASFMIDEDDDPQIWADCCFVTDQSSIGDFLSYLDEETPKHLQALGEKLGFPVERTMYLCDVAARMRGVQ
jgi:hypothetical protein